MIGSEKVIDKNRVTNIWCELAWQLKNQVAIKAAT
jgi:hypothetical protein